MRSGEVREREGRREVVEECGNRAESGERQKSRARDNKRHAHEGLSWRGLSLPPTRLPVPMKVHPCPHEGGDLLPTLVKVHG